MTSKIIKKGRSRRSTLHVASHSPLSDPRVFPGFMEEIEVLWNVRGKLQWWEAVVTVISSESAAAKKISATIQYKKQYKYNAEDYDVVFIRSTSGFRNLQHINPPMPSPTPWKYTDETVDKEDACRVFTSGSAKSTMMKETKQSAQLPSHMDLGSRTKDSTSTSSATSAPTSTDQTFAQGKSPRRKSKALIASTGSHIVTERVNSKKEEPMLVSPRPLAAEEGNDVESSIDIAPYGQADHEAHIKSEPSPANHSFPGPDALSAVFSSIMKTPSSTHTISEFIQVNLKYDVIQKFSAPLSRSRQNNSGLEGFISSEIVVTGKCDMDSFTKIVTPLMTSSSSSIHGSISQYHRFNPSKCAFRKQSRATSSLSVDFLHIEDMLQWMQIRDAIDHRRISIKSTPRKNDALLRILATTAVITLSNHPSPDSDVIVDCIVPLGSCSSYHMTTLASALRAELTSKKDSEDIIYKVEDSSVGAKQVVFYRCRLNYDESQGKYLSPWKAFHLDISCLMSMNQDENRGQTMDTESFFSVQWSQCRPLPNTLWTTDATFLGVQVLGDITSFFPSVTFFGASTIREIERLISDYL